MKQPSNVTTNETAQFVKNFFKHPDIVYIMPGMKDEITIWENGTKKREKNYYFIMFLRKDYKIYIELPVSDKVKFSKF